MNLQNYDYNERKVVYFINNSEYGNLQYFDDGKDLLTNQEVLIVPMRETNNFLDNFTIIENVQPYDRMLLTISPHDSEKYSEVSTANDNFALDKLTSILRLCQIIGAKKVFIENIFMKRNDEENSLKGSGNYATISGTMEYSSGARGELEKKIGYEANYSGAQSDYESAKKYLRRTRLTGDRFLSELVEMRSESNNRMESIKQVISLSSNVESTNSLLGSLKFPKAGGSFEMNSKKISEEKYYLEIKIDF